MNILAALLLSVSLLLAAGCSSPPKVVRPDPDIERNAAAGRAAFAGGGAEQAAAYYRKALDRARLVDNPAEIGRNAYNLALCLTLMKRYAAARALLDEARAEFGRAGLDPQEIQLLEAKTARRQGRAAEAVSLAQTLAEALAGRKDDACRLQAHLLLADVACDTGGVAQARAELTRADLKLIARAEPGVRAEAAQVQARILMLERKTHDAAVQLDAAAESFREAGRYQEMALALDEAGRAYEFGGEKTAALDRYYRAARSLLMGGDAAQAGEIAGRALPLAERTGNAEFQQRLGRLKTEIDARLKPAEPVGAPSK